MVIEETWLGFLGLEIFSETSNKSILIKNKYALVERGSNKRSNRESSFKYGCLEKQET